MRRLSYEEVKKAFNDRGYELLSKEYKNCREKLLYKCPRHPNENPRILYNDLRKGAGCPKCGTESRDMKRRHPFEKVKKLFTDRGYRLLETDYKNASTPLRFECPNHKEKETKISYSSLSSGASCAYCSKVGKPSIDEVNDYFNDRGYKLLSTEYINGRDKLKYECPNHPGVVQEMSFNNFKNGQRCALCFGTPRHTIEFAKEQFSLAGYTLIETKYVDNKRLMRFLCPKHPDKETKMCLRDLMRGTRCRFCYLDNNKGKNHPGYNHKLTDQEREYKRYYPEYYEWRRKVFERDGYSCEVCGDDRGGNLIAHHKDGYGWCKEKRTAVSNGATLCRDCHYDFHNKFGFKNNTEQQYIEWRTGEVSE